jgi:Na+/H+-dicarboxylate symporter
VLKGIILVTTIKPGDKETKRSVGEGTIKSTVTTQDAIMDLIRNLFPENIVQATIQQGHTYYTYDVESIIKPTNMSDSLMTS